MIDALLVLTDRRQSEAAGRDLAETIELAIAGGARAVLLREKDLPRSERADRCRTTVSALRTVGGGVVVVASDLALAREVGAAGVHLAARDPWPAGAARAGLIVGRSCHSADDVTAAAAAGADYVTLSPVFATASKPGYGPALGVGALAGHALPVYALGGVDATNAAACLRAGATGVAVMGGVMGASDPAAVVAAIRREVAVATAP